MNKKFIVSLILIAGGVIMFSCSGKKQLKSVEKVDLEKYMGSWYEIARFDHSFERGLKCVEANYEMRDDGKVTVLNKGTDEKTGKIRSAQGIAKVPDIDFPGVLKVSFFRPFWGNYYIIDLDKNYSYALVGEPSRKYLWVLSRTKTLTDDVYNDLLKKAESLGFDTGQLLKISHDCD
jgi:apolipoprotein D and lipocalin family protein